MSEFDFYGNAISESGNVSISAVKEKYPSYTDDQILAEAITLAQSQGGGTKIIWDGKDIYFSGQTSHVCKGFGGIDFNGSKIYMPNYDAGIILDIVPDTTTDLTISYSDILSNRTTNANLKDKVFTLNDALSGNDDMCIGYRSGDTSGVKLYYSPAVKAQKDGFYETGDLYLTPLSGSVICYNVHEYPVRTFELCNGVIVSSTGTNMSTLARCSRSNTWIHNFVLKNQSTKTAFAWGVFKVEKCVQIEVDHISGQNPNPRGDGGGYTLSLLSVSFAYVHDIHVGDSESWGCFGNRLLTNVVYERCYSNRWDCHFAQFGTIVLKSCVTSKINYGIGQGTITISDCILKVERTTASEPIIEMRDDCAGIFDGDIHIVDCEIQLGSQLPENTVILQDGSLIAIDSASKVTGSPDVIREIAHCKFPSQCKAIFRVKTHADDALMYENVTYIVKDSTFSCTDALVIADNTEQRIKKLIVDNCTFGSQFYITKTISDCYIDVKGVTAAGKNIRVKKNTNLLNVSDSVLASVVADQSSNKLIMTGCVLSGTQSVSNFTAYAFAGNIASDMASVNKHS